MGTVCIRVGIWTLGYGVCEFIFFKFLVATPKENKDQEANI